jgi:hypothetical protein
MILQPVGGGAKAAAILIGRFRWNQDLQGTKDGVNTSFVVPGGDTFVQLGDLVIRVYRNGQRLRLGLGNDYTVSESGGPGTGYDTVVFQGPAPLPYEELTADYLVP